MAQQATVDIDRKPPKVRGFTLWKIFRLIILGALVIVLGLMVQRPERIARTLPAAVALAQLAISR